MPIKNNHIGKKWSFKMKRAGFITALLILSITFSVSGQINVGLIGGLNNATLKHEFTEYKNRTLNAFGGVIDINIKENLYLRLEPMYIQKGWGVNKNDPNDKLEGKFSYFEVPVYVKLNVGSNIIPFILAGPTLGFLNNADITLTNNGLDFEGDIKNIVKKFDLGFGYGLGISVPVHKFLLFLELKNTVGSNFNKGGEIELMSGAISVTEEVERYRTRHKGIQMMIGVTYTLCGGK